MTRRRKPGPKPTLRRPVAVRVMLDGAEVARIDREAKALGVTRSEAVRRAVAEWPAATG